MAGAVEAARAQQTAQVALAVLATRAFLQAGQLWVRAMRSTSSPAKGAEQWASATMRALRIWRRQAREIALTSQSLTRALRTNEALHMPGDDRTPRVSLNRLRRNFERAVSDYAPSAFDGVQGLLDAEALPEQGASPLREIAGMRVPETRYEPWRSGGRDASLRAVSVSGLEKELRESEELWEREALRTLTETAKENLQRMKVAESKLTRDEAKVAEGDAARGKDLDVAARKAGSAAAHNTQSAARDASYRMGTRDRRVHAWIRVHYPKDGRGPCAFCAMLLSRGATYTSSEAAGGNIGSADQYHANCRCQAVPVYRGEDWRTMPEYEMNRFYEALWKKEYPMRGSQSARFNTWRRVIDAANRAATRSGTTRGLTKGE